MSQSKHHHPSGSTTNTGDQYRDPLDPAHNLSPDQLYHASGNALAHGKEFVVFRICDFNVGGGVNIDGCLPKPAGTTNIQEIPRIIAGTEGRQSVGSPAAIQVIVATFGEPFPVDDDPNGPWEWASDYL